MYLPGVTLFVAKVAFLSKLTEYCALFNLFVKDQLDVIVNVGSLSYVNVSDQSSIFTQETKMLISVCWKCFLAFNVLNMTKLHIIIK